MAKFFPFIFCILLVSASQAKTRWSALQFVPNADLLPGGSFELSAASLFYTDTLSQFQLPYVPALQIGLGEWVGISLGYSGGITYGLKARILSETTVWLPTLTAGFYNGYTHRENYLFADTTTIGLMSNEVYLVAARDIKAIRTRLSIGVQSMPMVQGERLSVITGVESYFGSGFYMSFEGFTRQSTFYPSLFLTWRTMRKKLEISLGAVALNKMLLSDDKKFSFALIDPVENSFVKPGLWFSIRYKGTLHFGRNDDGIKSVEEQFVSQEAKIQTLTAELRGLKSELGRASREIERMQQLEQGNDDSLVAARAQIAEIVYEKLMALKNVYTTDPFDPAKAKAILGEIILLEQKALLTLQRLALSDREDVLTRTLAVNAMGRIGNAEAVTTLTQALSSSNHPKITVEILIALGHLRATEALYLIQGLASHPDDAIAFTAQQVLEKLSGEDGVLVPENVEKRPVRIPDSHEFFDTPIIIPEPLSDSISQADTTTSQPKRTGSAETEEKSIAGPNNSADRNENSSSAVVNEQ